MLSRVEHEKSFITSGSALFISEFISKLNNDTKDCITKHGIPNPVAQSVASPIADLGVAISTPTLSHTFVKIDHEIVSMIIPPPPSTDSRGAVVGYKR